MNDEDIQRANILRVWAQNVDYSERDDVLKRDFDADQDIAETTQQIRFLLERFPERFNRLIECGSGDGRYLDYLSRLGLPLLYTGSDIDSPRLRKAQRDFPELTFEVGDILDVQNRHGGPNTVFLGIDLLGNIVPSDLNTFFAGIARQSSALVFCAGGLSLDYETDFKPRPGLGYNHNFALLVRRHRLRFLRYTINYTENSEQRAAITATVIPGGETSL